MNDKIISTEDIKDIEKAIFAHYQDKEDIFTIGLGFEKSSHSIKHEESELNQTMKLEFNKFKNNPTIERLSSYFDIIYELKFEYFYGHRESQFNIYLVIMSILMKYKENISPKYIVPKMIKNRHYKDFIKILIEKFGSDIINIKDKDGNNVISYINSIEIIDILMEYGIKDVPKIHFFYRKLDKSKILLEDISIEEKDKKFLNIAYKGYNPLFYILPHDNHCSIYTLNKNQRAQEYFEYINRSIKILIKNGIDINFQDRNGYTVLHNLINWNFVFINYSDNIDKSSIGMDVSLYEAKIYFIKLFILNGIKVNLQDKKGNTPLHSLFLNYFSSVGFIYTDVMLSSNVEGYELENEEEEKNRKRFNFKNKKLNNWHHFGDGQYISLHYSDVEKILSFLIDNGVDVNIQNSNGDTILHIIIENYREHYDSDSEELKKLILFFIKNGINLNLRDNYGETLLHYISYFYPKNFEDIHKNNEILKDIINLFIENGADINLQDNNNSTAFHYITSNISDFDTLKYFIELFVKFEVNFELVNNDGKKAIDFIRDFELREMVSNYIYNKPKQMVKLLSLFTKDNPLKYTTHSFEWSKYGSYQNFIDEIKKEFKKIEDELKILSPNLYTKINKFLFDSKLSENNNWGENKISFGWSSPELKEWCNNQDIIKSSKKAIYFPLPNKYQKEVEDKTLSNFGDICNVFKDEIEIRDNNRLISIFEEMEESVLGFDFEVEPINLENISFYTDVEYFKNGIRKIFEQFKERKEYENIKIEAHNKEDKNYIEISITQIDSVVYKSSSKMIKEIKDGDFYDMKNYFLSLCDWSIEAKFKDGNFKIKYLSNNKEVTKEPINNTPIGFTHILRFYK